MTGYLVYCLIAMIMTWALIICPPFLAFVERLRRPDPAMILAREPAKVYHLNRYR